MENKMKKLIKLLSVILTVFLLSLSVVACDKGEDYTCWQTEAKESGETRLIYVAELSFGSSNVDIAEIWINVSDFKAQTSTITINLSKTTSSTPTALSCPLNSTQVKEAEDGWIQIYKGSSVSCKIASIEVVDSMKINEICFIKKDGKLATVTFTQGGVKVKGSAKVYNKAGHEALTENDYAYNKDGNYSFNIIDEQDKFPTEKIQTKA